MTSPRFFFLNQESSILGGGDCGTAIYVPLSGLEISLSFVEYLGVSFTDVFAMCCVLNAYIPPFS